MARLIVLVLGSAAGGGYPQWNCGCRVCRLAWTGDSRVLRRTQTSLAATADGRHWTVVNAAPEIAAQIAATAVLHPLPCDPVMPAASGGRYGGGASEGDALPQNVRGSPIAAVVLTGGEVDQTAGLLTLRERHRFDLVATAETLAVLDRSPVFDVLDRGLVARRPAALGDKVALPGGLEATLFPVPGKVPLYLEAGRDGLAAAPEGNVGVELAAGGARAAFVPGAAAVDAALAARLGAADLVLFDGTLYTDDEMFLAGAGDKTGRRMGHLPIAGPDGSLAALKDLTNRRLYIHINNTNPVLVAGSPERQAVEAAGWDVAHDGMRFAL